MVRALFPEMAKSLFQPLLDRLARDGQGQDFTPDDVRELLFACGAGAAVLDELMRRLWILFERGLESRKARFLESEFADVVELALRQVYPKAHTITVASTLPEAERLSSLDTLDELAERARAVRQELDRLRAWLERPTPQVDLAKVLGNRPPQDYEGYVDTADLEP